MTTDEQRYKTPEAARRAVTDKLKDRAVRITANGAQSARVKVRSLMGAKLWAAFQIDIVADGVVMTGLPEPVPPLTEVRIIDRERAIWKAYPLVDHVADKVCAILERHNGKPSTRFKDLVDLVAISRGATVEADLQKRALGNEAVRRDLELPAAFDVPDRTIWERGYRAEARRTVGLGAVDLEAALTVVRPFLDPLLDGTATGSWGPDARAWA